MADLCAKTRTRPAELSAAARLSPAVAATNPGHLDHVSTGESCSTMRSLIAHLLGDYSYAWDCLQFLGLCVLALWNLLRRTLARGRRRHQQSRSRCPTWSTSSPAMKYAPATTLLLFASACLRVAECCSSRSTPKPRQPSAPMRPNITFPTYTCPPAYATWYCLNGATCFTVEISESILYNCVCADGYTGPRCEFKDLDGSYLPSREKVMVEKASIAGGVTVAVLLIVIISILFFIYSRRKKDIGKDEVDGSVLSGKPFHMVRMQKSIQRASEKRLPEPDLEACGEHGTLDKSTLPTSTQSQPVIQIVSGNIRTSRGSIP